MYAICKLKKPSKPTGLFVHSIFWTSGFIYCIARSQKQTEGQKDRKTKDKSRRNFPFHILWPHYMFGSKKSFFFLHLNYKLWLFCQKGTSVGHLILLEETEVDQSDISSTTILQCNIIPTTSIRYVTQNNIILLENICYF